MPATQWFLQTMNSIDRLKLLAGFPIEMSDGTCFIYPATLRDIAALGTEQYFKYLNVLTLSEEDIKKFTLEENNVFIFLTLTCKNSEVFKREFISAIKYFTKEEVTFLEELDSFVIGDFEESRILGEDNFFEFQKILSTQNGMNTNEVRYTGEDEAAKMIKAKLAKAREKVDKSKSFSEEKQPDLVDLISSLCSRDSLNICEVLDTPYYSFNIQFKRMRMYEEYETGLQSIMAGADPKKIKLKDWIRSIQ